MECCGTLTSAAALDRVLDRAPDQARTYIVDGEFQPSRHCDAEC
jgi:hypothetical protein